MISANSITPENKSIWSRPQSIFLAASLTILFSALIPCPPIVLDVIWIFVFLITGAVTWVCFAARSSTDLFGLASLVSLLTLLRLSLLTIAAGKIIKDLPAGILLIKVGNLLAGSGALGGVLVCLLLAAIVVIIVFGTCQRITISSNNFLKNILPLKQVGIDTDLKMETIDEQTADKLQERINCEGRFFSGMNSAALLMRSEVAINIFTLIACLIIPMTIHSSQILSGSEHLSAIAPLVIGLSVFSLVPALVISVSCGMLVGKDTLALRTNQDEETVVPPRKIKIVTGVDNQEEEIELINPEFLQHKDVDERIVEFEVSTENNKSQANLSSAPKESTSLPRKNSIAQVIQMQCKNANDYYEQLRSLIYKMRSNPCLVLLASDVLPALPVTVPVNIAIRLAQKKQKVLLVDAEAHQNAVAQVFEMNPKIISRKIQKSCFENLSVCNISKDSLGKLLRKKDILNRFDTVLIYAPATRCLKSKDNAKTDSDIRTLYFTDRINEVSITQIDDLFRGSEFIGLVPAIRSILQG